MGAGRANRASEHLYNKTLYIIDLSEVDLVRREARKKRGDSVNTASRGSIIWDSSPFGVVMDSVGGHCRAGATEASRVAMDGQELAGG